MCKYSITTLNMKHCKRIFPKEYLWTLKPICLKFLIMWPIDITLCIKVECQRKYTFCLCNITTYSDSITFSTSYFIIYPHSMLNITCI